MLDQGVLEANKKFARWQLEKAADASGGDVNYHLQRAARAIGREDAAAMGAEMGFEFDWSSISLIRSYIA